MSFIGFSGFKLIGVQYEYSPPCVIFAFWQINVTMTVMKLGNVTFKRIKNFHLDRSNVNGTKTWSGKLKGE